MAGEARKIYSFVSKALDKDALEVVRFHGEEGLSRLYRFEVTLLARSADLDLTDVVQHPAVFTIHFPEGDLPFHGILARFEQLRQYSDMTFYRAILVPRAWWLTQTHHNQLFLDKTLPELLTEVLKDGGLRAGQDFELRLMHQYPRRDYVCQYGETHFNFVSRWMERDGLYSFFEQTDANEKLVITDSASAHAPMSQGGELTYHPVSGLDWPMAKEVIKRLDLVQRPVPATVKLKDYNYRHPDVDMTATHDVAAYGRGEYYVYGEHFATVAEGEALAKVQAEAFQCGEKRFEGLSTVPYVRSGFIFTLKNHFRDDFNTKYLTVSARHEGGQEAWLTSGLGLPLQVELDRPGYRNTFEAIEAKTQFRPERTARKPRFDGCMTAMIDAGGSGEYAELDDQGRYKITLPFDLSGRSGGKASAFVRMIQPYGGADHGLHFPLHKGTEVILTCIDGDPDRPLIQACVPNPDTPSQVDDSTKTSCRLTTSGNNKLHIENQKGSERILMSSPTKNSYIRLGQPNDPPASAEKAPDQLGWKLNTDGAMKIRAGLYNQMTIGDTETWIVGNQETALVLESNRWSGVYLKTGLCKKQEINTITFISAVLAQRALGQEVCCSPQNVKIAGQLTEMKGTKTNLEGLKQQLEGQKNQLEMAKQTLEESQNTLTGDLQNLRMASEIMTQQVLDLEGKRTALQQAKQEISTAKSTLEGQKSTLEQQKTTLTTSITDMTLKQTELAQKMDRINATRNRIVAKRTIV